jgi:hypothetical protein
MRSARYARTSSGTRTQAERDRHRSGTAVGKRQAFGVGRHPLDARNDAAVDRAVAAHDEHRRVDIAHRDARLGRAAVDAECDVAGAAGHVHEIHAVARAQGIDERVLPQAVQAAAHQVVHQVVAAGDAAEDAADEPGLFAGRHVGKAEIGRARSARRRRLGI